jgi:hypothetical protein
MSGRLHTREDSGICLDAQLRWWHDGEPVEHPRIIEAFNRGLTVSEDGRYKLLLGPDWCFVTVAGPAFAVLAVDVGEGERLSVRLSDRTAEWLEPATLSLDAEGVLFAKVKQGRASARFSREAQVQLGAFLEPRGETLALHVGSAWHPTPLAVPSLR